MNSDCSVWKFQASFDLKDAVYASATAWKDIKGCYPMRNLNKLWRSVMSMKYLSKEEESEGCNIKAFLNILSMNCQFLSTAIFNKIQRTN